jgi:hypothetical protein
MEGAMRTLATDDSTFVIGGENHLLVSLWEERLHVALNDWWIQSCEAPLVCAQEMGGEAGSFLDVESVFLELSHHDRVDILLKDPWLPKEGEALSAGGHSVLFFAPSERCVAQRKAKKLDIGTPVARGGTGMGGRL